MIGRSFGSIIAIEMANQLQKQGHVAYIICADGSIDFVKQLLKSYLFDGAKHVSEDKLQIDLLCHLVSRGMIVEKVS